MIRVYVDCMNVYVDCIRQLKITRKKISLDKSREVKKTYFMS